MAVTKKHQNESSSDGKLILGDIIIYSETLAKNSLPIFFCSKESYFGASKWFQKYRDFSALFATLPEVGVAKRYVISWRPRRCARVRAYMW